MILLSTAESMSPPPKYPILCRVGH